MSDWTICITPMPTEEALDIAARIADAEEPDCEDLLLTEGARVCDVLRCEVLHQAEVIERRTADLSTATGEIARLRAALAEAHAIIDGRKVPPTTEEIAAHEATGGRWLFTASTDIGGRPLPVPDVSVADAGFNAYEARDGQIECGDAVHWWPLDATGRPCAWPVVEVPHG